MRCSALSKGLNTQTPTFPLEMLPQCFCTSEGYFTLKWNTMNSIENLVLLR